MGRIRVNVLCGGEKKNDLKKKDFFDFVFEEKNIFQPSRF